MFQGPRLTLPSGGSYAIYLALAVASRELDVSHMFVASHPYQFEPRNAHQDKARLH